MSKHVLQIYEEGTPLTRIEVSRVLQNLADKYIREAANSVFKEGNCLPKRCDNKRHSLYKKFVGGGICLAKKYRRCDMTYDLICSTCESDVITKTLNYIFERYYRGRYTSAWRTVRSNKKCQLTREKVVRKRGEEKKQEQLEIVNGLTEEPKEQKKGHP